MKVAEAATGPRAAPVPISASALEVVGKRPCQQAPGLPRRSCRTGTAAGHGPTGTGPVVAQRFVEIRILAVNHGSAGAGPAVASLFQRWGENLAIDLKPPPFPGLFNLDSGVV